MIPIQDTKKIMDEFRAVRKNVCADKKTTRLNRNNISHVPPKNARKDVNHYEVFRAKLADLENSIDSFKTRDLVYYFREIAKEAGYKYVISNIKKDMSIMKRASENYSPKELCGMIEFLYTSEQDYLDKDRLSPNLLVSSWVNTIYADTMLWVEDKYVPASKKRHCNKEWTQTETTSSIGEWE